MSLPLSTITSGTGASFNRRSPYLLRAQHKLRSDRLCLTLSLIKIFACSKRSQNQVDSSAAAVIMDKLNSSGLKRTLFSSFRFASLLVELNLIPFQRNDSQKEQLDNHDEQQVDSVLKGKSEEERNSYEDEIEFHLE